MKRLAVSQPIVMLSNLFGLCERVVSEREVSEREREREGEGGE